MNEEVIYPSMVIRSQAEAIELLEKENKQLKEQLLVAQTNEETFRLEMEDITRALGLAEDTLFDDVKVYARSLKDDWNKLKAINKEYERLNKKNGRGFKITNVQEYNIDELLSYKENWNKLKEWLESNWKESQDIWFVKIINKMQELEQGSDSDE